MPCYALGFLFCGLLLPELCELPLILSLELLRFPHVLILRAFEPLQFKRVHRSSCNFLIQKKIGAEPAAFALNRRFLFGFILLFGLSLIHLGIAIAALRKMRGMSQEQLAEKAGISRSLISAIEAPGLAKSFSLDVFFNLADALDIDPADLINATVFPDRIFKQK